MAAAPLVLAPTDFILCMVCVLLTPLAATGLAIINTGFARTRSAAHSVVSAFCLMAVAVLAYFVVGFAIQGFAGGPAHSLVLRGHTWNWIGAEHVFMRKLPLDGPAVALIACLQAFSVAVAAMIPLGSGAERWRFGASCASTALLAGFVYPLFAHWVWGGGWLAQLGVVAKVGNGAIDAGGAGVIQAVGGVTALGVAWVLGPRRGKFDLSGMPGAIPGHNLVFVILGCMIAFVGWLGLDSAGAILFAGVSASRIIMVALNNAVAASTALITAFIVTGVRFGKPDASITANAFIMGLVAVSGACAFVSPAAAAAIGLVAGVVIPFSVEWVDRLGVDDASGAISVHGLGGIWGVLAVALFVHNSPGQWLAQVAMVATLLGFVLPVSYGLNVLLDRVYRQRVSREGERRGMDMAELGANAYPELTPLTTDYLYR